MSVMPILPFLDAANLEAGAGQRAEGGLPAGAGALGLVATRRAHLDVKRGQAELLLCREGGGNDGRMRERSERNVQLHRLRVFWFCGDVFILHYMTIGSP